MSTAAVQRFYENLFSQDFFVCDPDTPYFQEKLLQVIWNEQLLNPDLTTAAGEKLHVIHPGTWTVESGPDFHDATLSVDGRLQRGAVEVHRRPGEWFHHHHGANPDYRDTILHVVWQNPDGRPTCPEHVPLCVLHDQLSVPLETIMAQVDLTMYPYARKVSPRACAATLAQLPDRRLRELLLSYGLTRTLGKAQRLAAAMEAHGPEQACYQGLCDVMGYKNNRKAFAMLAQAVPAATLAGESPATALALLLGAAGLLPDPSRHPITDARRDWLRELWDRWWPHRQGGTLIHWNRHRARPTNSPERRVLAAHVLMQQCDCRPAQMFVGVFRRHTSPKACLRALGRALTLPHEPDLERFLNFGADLKRPAALLGQARRRDLIVNLAVPFFMAWCLLRGEAELCRRAKDVLCAAPRLQSNRRFEEAAHHFLIPPTRTADVVAGACAQLGLLQLYEEFHLVGS